MGWKWVLLLLVLPVVQAAVIHGTVYTIELQRADNAIVEINTTPNQKFVATGGEFSFEVRKGQYALHASSEQGQVQENITAAQNGTYRIDLILFPNLDEPVFEERLEVPEVGDVIEESRSEWWPMAAIGLAVVLGIALAVFWVRKRKQSPSKAKPDDDLTKILDVLDEHGGRATQKQIRKQVPFSEAKVSLMIAELEEKGRIKRIRKGRGNIIVRK